MKPRVFLTGASGFIGGYVLQEFFENGWEVHALVHKAVSSKLEALRASGGVELHRGDCTDFDSLRHIFNQCENSFDAVVHCAGRASDVGTKQVFRRTNYESVQHLARLSLGNRGRRFVFISSTDVYGMHDFSGETEAALPLESRPVNPYPEFKIKAEQWLSLNMPEDRYTVVRPAAVWGAGDLTITKRVMAFLRLSPSIVHFGKWKGTNRWPLAHVRNVAAATFLLATLPEWGGRAVNVLDTERVSIDAFYRIIAKAFFPEKTYNTISIPFKLASPFARLITAASTFLGLPQPFMDPSHYALLSVSSNLDFSNETFLELMRVGAREPVSLAEGVEELLSNATGPDLYSVGNK